MLENSGRALKNQELTLARTRGRARRTWDRGWRSRIRARTGGSSQSDEVLGRAQKEAGASLTDTRQSQEDPEPRRNHWG